MNKKLLFVAVAAALWNTVTLANLQPTSESATPTSPTVEEISYQRLRSAATSVTADPFAPAKEGAYHVAPLCWTFVDPWYGFAEEICW
jgi:hypothetical protein